MSGAERLLCAWCSVPFEREHRKGPTPVYCCTAHRVAAYKRRRFDAALAVSRG